MVQSAVDGARQAGIEISMCGEMAGDPAYSLVLLALGLDVLSMNPADIPPVKRVLRSAELRDARELLEAAMAFSSVDEIERFVVEQMRKRFPQLVSDPRDRPEPRPAARDLLPDVKLEAGS
jgi:phosphotransferase system enzyme I (PtsI)